jgi:hypothetical protein
MLELGVNVGIGTDGAASNNDLDMFEETRLAALLAKGTSGDPTSIPARTALAMATRIGAAAMHMDHLTGSLEPGKRADLIVLDLDRLHNVPAFAHDAGGIYSQIVYASKSTDVVDVMCNGRWLMRNRALLTLDERELREAARAEAARVDTFLSSREVSVLQKLVAVGGAVEQESFEIQVKARVASAEQVLSVINGDQLTAIRSSHYHQYDTYWSFDDPDQGWLRYREDEFLDDAGNVTGARSRLTLTGRTTEDHFGAVLLSAAFYRLRALGAVLPRILPPGRRTNRRKDDAGAGRVSRRRVLRAPDRLILRVRVLVEVKSRTGRAGTPATRPRRRPAGAVRPAARRRSATATPNSVHWVLRLSAELSLRPCSCSVLGPGSVLSAPALRLSTQHPDSAPTCRRQPL